MVERIARWEPDQSAAVTARAIGALALVALAVIHVVDLPGTLGPTPLVGIGYLGIISAAVLIGVGIGVGVGMLLAPASGEETRENLADRVRDRFSREKEPSTGTYGV